ncbi:MAG TPA: thiamine phosphate synthase [Bacteroidales bacterium]|nr:thiamine phosphate synthase [Bacteroidales bacterium]
MNKQIEKFQYITGQHHLHSYAELAKLAYMNGCRWVQLRMKGHSATQIEEEARKSLAEANIHNGILIINDHPEIARATGAHGVHLGKDDMQPSRARQILGYEAIIGGTANTFDDIIRLVDEEVDYIGLGPFRYTTSKKNLSPILGLDGYTEVMERLKELEISIPIIAIGGITVSDIEQLLNVGLHGLAVSGAVSVHELFAGNIRQFVNKTVLNNQIKNIP